MKQTTQTSKFDELIESYINGNISWVKEQVKKLSKDNRKNLYQYIQGRYVGNDDINNFFFNLI